MGTHVYTRSVLLYIKVNKSSLKSTMDQDFFVSSRKRDQLFVNSKAGGREVGIVLSYSCSGWSKCFSSRTGSYSKTLLNMLIILPTRH